MNVKEKIESVTCEPKEFEFRGETFTAYPVKNKPFLKRVQNAKGDIESQQELILMSLNKGGEGDLDMETLDEMPIGFTMKAVEAALEANGIEKNQFEGELMETK